MATTEEQALEALASTNTDGTAKDVDTTVSTPINEPDTEEAAPEDEDWYNDPVKVRAAVKDARDEAAATRVKGNSYHDAFEEYNDFQREWMLGVVKGLSGSGAQQAAAIEELRSILPVDEEPESEEKPAEKATATLPEGDVTASGLTLEQVQELINKASTADRSRDSVDVMVRDIATVAAKYNYAKDTVEYETIMTIARKNTDPNKTMTDVMEDAVSTFRASQQGVIDAFVKEQQEQGVRFPTQSRMSAGPPATDDGDDDWMGDPKKTKLRAIAHMKARSGKKS